MSRNTSSNPKSTGKVVKVIAYLQTNILNKHHLPPRRRKDFGKGEEE